MKYKFTITVGKMQIEFEDEAKNQKDFFGRIAPFSSIPSEGPKGFESAPLEFSHRVVKNREGKDCSYYSIVCRQANQEFKFGVLSNDSGALYPKGWQPIRYGINEDDHASENSESGELGEQWCEWCNDRPSVPGVPCSSCASLGAMHEEQPPVIEKPAQSQSSNVTSINRPAADVPKINVDQFAKIESLINDLVSLNIGKASILEKLHKNFGVTDLRQITSAQSDVAIKQLTARIQDIEKALRENATRRVSA